MTAATDGRSGAMASSSAATFVTKENPRDYVTVYDNAAAERELQGKVVGISDCRFKPNRAPALVVPIGMLRLRRSSASLHSGSAQHDRCLRRSTLLTDCVAAARCVLRRLPGHGATP